jgi:hypothetical protein
MSTRRPKNWCDIFELVLEAPASQPKNTTDCFRAFGYEHDNLADSQMGLSVLPCVASWISPEKPSE